MKSQHATTLILRRLKDERGRGLAEYSLAVASLSLAVVAVFSGLSGNAKCGVREATTAISNVILNTNDSVTCSAPPNDTVSTTDSDNKTDGIGDPKAQAPETDTLYPDSEALY